MAQSLSNVKILVSSREIEDYTGGEMIDEKQLKIAALIAFIVGFSFLIIEFANGYYDNPNAASIGIPAGLCGVFVGGIYYWLFNEEKK
jgi:hypothetical protein